MTRKDRPRLTIVAKAIAPYRLHLHTRICREIPEVHLDSLFLNAHNNQPWAFNLPEEINAVFLEEPGGAARHTQPGAKVRPHLWRKGGRVIEMLRKNRPGAVVLTGYHDLCRIRIILWCRRHGVPLYIFSDANVASDRERGLWRILKTWYLRWVVRNISGLLICGSAGQAYYRPYGGDAKPSFYVPHETDYEAMDALTAEQIDDVRKRYGLRDDRRYIVYCGRMAQKKRVDLLVDAFARIADERPEWDLLLIGDGPKLESLKQRVPDSLRDRVIWPGFVNDRDTIGCLYRASDVFVLPSENEPWGAVVAEACGAGLAVICSDVIGAAQEMCREGVNGRMFRSGDAESLASALIDVTDPDHIDRMREATRDVLAEWRERGDPVKGIRGMLAHAGVLTAGAVQERAEVAT